MIFFASENPSTQAPRNQNESARFFKWLKKQTLKFPLSRN